MGVTFVDAVRYQSLIRFALLGPAGAGKTFSALAIASHLDAGPIGVIDSERGSARKYAGERSGDAIFAFKVAELHSFEPQTYIAAIKAAAAAGFTTLIIDSLSHAWMGKGGALEQLDNETKRSTSKNSFDAWRKITPIHNDLVDAMLAYPGHLLVTMRTKSEFVIEKDDRGKNVPRKIGVAPIQRDGLEFEFDVVADMTLENEMLIGKTRCSPLAQKTFCRPGKEVADILLAWANVGDAAPAPAPTAPAPAPVGELVPEQAVALTRWTEELAKTTNPEALQEMHEQAKVELKGEALNRYRRAYNERFVALNPDWKNQKAAVGS